MQCIDLVLLKKYFINDDLENFKEIYNKANRIQKISILEEFLDNSSFFNYFCPSAKTLMFIYYEANKFGKIVLDETAKKALITFVALSGVICMMSMMHNYPEEILYLSNTYLTETLVVATENALFANTVIITNLAAICSAVMNPVGKVMDYTWQQLVSFQSQGAAIEL